MSLEKLQKIATTPVNDKYIGKWLMWWNSTPMPCESLRFLQPNFRNIDLDDWFVNASFWAHIIQTISLVGITML